VEATRAAVPADNPQTPEKIALGEKLFFDGRLSLDGTVACSTCHDPARAFTDGRPVSIGVTGRAGQRNAPTILNALYDVAQFSQLLVLSRPIQMPKRIVHDQVLEGDRVGIFLVV
jgi:cytochrome c peroxidase